MHISDIIILIWIHFFADFILQTDDMAIKKSKDIWWLFIHSFFYMIPFCIYPNIAYGIINGCSHFLIDLVTSKITTCLYQKDKRHWFFVVIGLDQAIHLTILILTFKMV